MKVKRGVVMDIEQFNKYLSEYQECQPLNVSKSAVYKFADELAGDFEETGEDYNIYEIINKFGGHIHNVSLFQYSDISGSIIIHGKENFDVLIPEYTSPIRDKFTLAHELGHYILHSQLGEKSELWALREGSGRLEWEANWFAAGFLMPASKMKELVEQKGLQNIDEHFIRNYFAVSLEAADIRLKTFKENSY